MAPGYRSHRNKPASEVLRAQRRSSEDRPTAFHPVRRGLCQAREAGKVRQTGVLWVGQPGRLPRGGEVLQVEEMCVG